MHRLPPWESLIEHAAARCAALLADRPLPDLSDTLVLLPGLHAAAPLRARIHALSGRRALIGPVCHTLGSLGGTLAPARRAREQRARLMLLDALREHPGLNAGHDPWTLVEALVALFAELGDATTGVPDDEASFAATLRDAYGTGVPERPLRREAALVATLWRAWKEREIGGTGDGAAAVDALAAWRDGGGAYLIVAGIEPMPAVVDAWLDAAVTAGWATRFETGDDGSSPPDAVAALAAAALPTGPDRQPLAARAAELAARWPSPPEAHALAAAAADDPEHEARVVDVQIRQWWLAGHRRIALVTDDRKLARRVRALLARAGLPLEDAAGWALSTTSAAAALERWLEAVEEGHRASPLLDLLKSPFCRVDDDHDAQLQAAWLFEEGIVRREQVGRGLDAYRQAIRRRAARLPDEWGRSLRERLERMLDRVEHASAPLMRHARQPSRRFPAAELADAQHESLVRLGLHAGLADDPAGQRVREELDAMAAAARDGAPALDWREWRTWLGRTLERATFRQSADGIALLSLADCATGSFDAVIIAGADAEHLPGRPHAHPFFNDGVRAELGLDTWSERRARAALQFRCALALAPLRTITRARNRQQAERLPSPWLEALDAVYLLAWGRPLPAPDAATLARHPRALVVNDDAPMPAASVRPRPIVDRVPARWSVSAHQELVDCPYRWFAARRLRLEAPDPLREALSKQDFGELVHRCLHAFHADLPGLPGPFGRAVDEQNKPEAVALLIAIGDAVLADEAASDFVARAWLRAWREAAPWIAEFEAARAASGWRVVGVEHVFAVTVEGATLQGRIDRVEVDGEGRHAVLDYKTGATAAVGAITAGENVQLASYAAGIGATRELSFVALAPALKGGKVALTGVPSARTAVDVAALVDAVIARFGDAVRRLREHAEAPAWGDAQACAYCRFDGLCRRGTWSDA